MNGKSFFGLMPPQIVYPPIANTLTSVKTVSSPKRATFLIENDRSGGKALLNVDDAVKTGQKLTLFEGSPAYAISSITGKITDISEFPGDFGKQYLAVTVEAADKDEGDTSFEEAAGETTLQTAIDFLSYLPGAPDFSLFADDAHGIHTLVVVGADKDLLMATNQFVATSKAEALKNGIALIKEITGIDQVLVVVPQDLVQNYSSIGAEVKAVKQVYPAALPHSIMKDVVGKTVPAGKTPTDVGFCFFSAEGVAAIGEAVKAKQLPATKLLTVIGKDGTPTLVEAKIGTPIRSIIAACGESVNEKDRLILGGPMTGVTIFTEEYPVCPDTDAVMVQDSADVALVADTPCINCGDCIRVCPVNVPINLLVRFLEAGAYEDAEILYDLHSCIECGLCSYVCVSKIPIFQYIRLAKHELSRAQAAEATND